jgi:hypothetical protein
MRGDVEGTDESTGYSSVFSGDDDGWMERKVREKKFGR